MNAKMRIISSIASSRALTVLASKQTHRTRFSHLCLPEISVPNVDFSSRKVFARSFHGGTCVLDFRASSFMLHPGYAVADDLDEDKLPKSSGDGLDISKLGISQDIVSALAKRGITKLFPIQKAVLEPAMQGRDMIGRARTGTGKTLAFGIPILDKIIQFNAKNGRGRNPLALVMAPTRELARQVDKEFAESAPNLDTICVYGGTPIQRQMSQLDYGVDVVVGTPGRVIDLLKRGALNLSEVQFVVLDEADQMLNVGFEEDVEVILEKLPRKRQSLMFSATMPNWIRQLTTKYLKNPLIIDLVGNSDQKLAEGITLYSIVADFYGKASAIGPLITEHAKGGKCIVFTQTKRDADRLAHAMGKSQSCEPLHGDISQHQRERTLSGFRDGRFNVLVATDVAARGLDIPNVDLVIHYELPTTSEIFVHRSGRTGRAGKKGNAILIYTEDQYKAVKGIEREVGCRFIELPRIPAGKGGDMFDDMGRGGGGRSYGYSGSYGGGGGGRYGSSSRRSGGYGRSDGYGKSGFGRSGGYGSSGSGGYGSSGSGGYGSSGSGGYGSSGSGGYGSSGSGGYGSSGSGGYGSSGSGGYGSSGRSGLGQSSSWDRTGGFGSSGSDRTGRFGESNSGRAGSFGSFGSFGSGFGSSGSSSGQSKGFGSLGLDSNANGWNSQAK